MRGSRMSAGESESPCISERCSSWQGPITSRLNRASDRALSQHPERLSAARRPTATRLVRRGSRATLAPIGSRWRMAGSRPSRRQTPDGWRRSKRCSTTTMRSFVGRPGGIPRRACRRFCLPTASSSIGALANPSVHNPCPRQTTVPGTRQKSTVRFQRTNRAV